MVGVPIVIVALSWACAPEYFGPMLKEPIGIAMLIGALIWLVIGAFLLMITSGWRRRVVCVLVTFPVILMAMLGPAVLTIATALGPVVGS